MMAVANSGPDDPAAMSVAPATSGGRFNTEIKECEMSMFYNQARFLKQLAENITALGLEVSLSSFPFLKARFSSSRRQ